MRNLLILTLCAILTACAAYSSNRYSPSSNNTELLKTAGAKPVNIGNFTSTIPGLKEIWCRGDARITTQDGEQFSDFIRNALQAELNAANAYSAEAPVTITGNIDEMDFSSNSGNWVISVTLKSSNGAILSLTENYKFNTSIDTRSACNQTAQAMVPAVQNLITRIIKSPKFAALTRK